MDGRHDTALDGSVFIKSLCHGSEAVGGAGSGGNDLVVCGEGTLVYAVNDGGKIIACGSGDNNLLSAGVDMSGSLFLGGVEAGAFENDIDFKLLPGAVVCVLFGIDLYGLAVDGDGAGFVIGGYFVVVSALSGVVFEKVSKHFRAGEVVDGNDLITLCAEHLSECKATDTAEAVNSNFY